MFGGGLSWGWALKEQIICIDALIQSPFDIGFFPGAYFDVLLRFAKTFAQISKWKWGREHAACLSATEEKMFILRMETIRPKARIRLHLWWMWSVVSAIIRTCPGIVANGRRTTHAAPVPEERKRNVCLITSAPPVPNPYKLGQTSPNKLHDEIWMFISQFCTLQCPGSVSHPHYFVCRSRGTQNSSICKE